MKSTIKAWKRSREIITGILQNYSEEQLVKTPNGFNNSLLWNIGHILTVNQKLIYKATRTPIVIPDNIFSQYDTGTFPNAEQDLENLLLIKQLLPHTFEKSISDYQSSTLGTFNELTTGTGFHLASIEEAFAFNNYHEALHIGLMLNLKKFI